MVNEINGSLDGTGLKIGIAVSRFNDTITSSLLDGAVKRLQQLGVADSDIDVVWVPGAFELSQTVHWMESTNNYDGIMTLGCVIRGDTPHFDYVSGAASSGLSGLASSSKTPIVFGVLTCDTVEQAQTRSGIKSNKGVEVTDGLIELINVRKQLDIS